MKNKKFFLASLIVFMILMIGAVSASADYDEIGIASDDISLDELAIDNSQNNPVQEIEAADEFEAQENVASDKGELQEIAIADEEELQEDDTLNQNQVLELESSDEDKLEQEVQEEEKLTFTSDDLNVDFPKTGLIGFGDDRDSLILKIDVPKDSSGKLSIYENTNLLDSFELKGKETKWTKVAIVYTEDLNIYTAYIYPSKAGDIKYTIKYEEGTDSFEKSANVNVSYILSCLNKICYGDTALQIMLPYGGTGKYNVYIDGKKYSTYTKNADTVPSYFVKLSPLLSIGKHKVKISYLGDGKYPSRTVEKSLLVVGKINIPTSKFTNNEVISLKLPTNAKGYLVVRVYNYQGKFVKKFTQKLVKGKASISFSKNKFFGTYSSIEAKYTGTDYKVSSEIMDEVTINPPIVLTKKMLKGEKKYLSINLPGKKGVLKLYYEVKGKDGTYKTKVLSKKLVKGKAKIALLKLAVGSHDLKIKFIQTLKSGKKVSYVYYRQLNVVKPLKITAAKKLYYGTAKVKIQAYKSGGKVLANKYIKVLINKKLVKKVKTNSKGIATFKIPKKYKPKTYKITATYNKYSTYKNIRIYKASA